MGYRKIRNRAIAVSVAAAVAVPESSAVITMAAPDDNEIITAVVALAESESDDDTTAYQEEVYAAETEPVKFIPKTYTPETVKFDFSDSDSVTKQVTISDAAFSGTETFEGSEYTLSTYTGTINQEGLSDISITSSEDGKANISFKVSRAFSANRIYLVEKISDNKCRSTGVSVSYKKEIAALGELDENGNVKTSGVNITDGKFSYYGTESTSLSSVIIRAKYGQTAVTGVGKITGKNVRTVVVPYGVTEIAAGTFPETAESVILPVTVKKIASGAFAGNNNTTVYYNGYADQVTSGGAKTVKPYGNRIAAGSEIKAEITETGVTVTAADETLPVSVVPFAAPVASDDAVDASKIKWTVETPDGNVSSLAKFVKGSVLSNSVTGTASVTVRDLKASGFYNSNVVIKAADVENPDIVYAYIPLFVTPSRTSRIEVDTSADYISAADSSANEYNISVEEGKSVRIPAKAAGGVDTALVYKTSSSNITVINGIIKGITASDSTDNAVYIYPQDAGVYTSSTVSDTVVKLNVEVKAKAKITSSAVTTDVKAVSLVNDTSAVFSVNTPASSFSFDYDDTKFVIKKGDTVIPEDTDTLPGEFTIERKDGDTAPGTKDTIKITDKNGKKASISVSVTGTYQNITRVVEPNARKLTDDSTVNCRVAEINMVKGTSFKLGISAVPASVTKADLTWNYRTEDGSYAPADDIVTKLAIAGDVITAKETGTYYIQAELSGEDTAGNNPKTSLYRINVYETGGSIAYSPAVTDDYVIQGGYLISRIQSETACSKNIEGGKAVVMTAPATLGNNEDITWTSSSSGGLSIDTVMTNAQSSQLKFRLIQPGTYTVTGTSKYTKQKFSFKVVVAAPAETKAEFMTNTASIEVFNGTSWGAPAAGSNDGSESGKPYLLTVGETLQIRPASSACGTVTYKSDDTNIVTVDYRGNIRARAALDKDIKITVTVAQKEKDSGILTEEFYVRAAAPSGKGGKTPEIVLSVPSSVQKGSAVTVKTSAINFAVKNPDVSYSVLNADGTTADVSVGTDGKLIFTASGTYTVKASAEGAEAAEKIINVYDVLATKAAVHPEDVAKVKRLGTAGRGIAGDKSVIIDFLATGLFKDDDGKVSAVNASDDMIDWTSSNTYLATASSAKAAHGVAGGVHTSEEICDKDDAYGHSVIITANDKGYTGTVVLTGTFRNSGKKVSVKVNIKP